MTDTPLLSLARHETSAIEVLWRRIQGLPAKSRVLEDHVESDALRGALGPVLGQPAWLVASLLEAVLAERGSFQPVVIEPPVAIDVSTTPPEAAPVRVEYRASRNYGTTSPELVCSGATPPRPSSARPWPRLAS